VHGFARRFDALCRASYVSRMRTNKAPQALAAIFAAACLLTAAAAAQDAPVGQPDLSEPDLPQTDLSQPGPPQSALPAPDRLPSDEALPDDAQPNEPDLAAPAPNPNPEARPSPESNKVTRSETPKDRETMLAELYAHLAKAPDATQAEPIAKTIEQLWLNSGSPTLALLMHRALKAVGEERNDLALKLLDAVVDLGPDYAEGWSRRAYIYYLQNDYDHAVGDLRRALALEPNHFKALDGLAKILRESGQKKSALKVYEQLLRIYPFMPGAKEAADELRVEVEGQGI
jgi:tetratricopeptide (TPR) repeat protein